MKLIAKKTNGDTEVYKGNFFGYANETLPSGFLCLLESKDEEGDEVIRVFHFSPYHYKSITLEHDDADD